MNSVGLTLSVFSVQENMTAVELLESTLITGVAAPAEWIEKGSEEDYDKQTYQFAGL